MATHPAPERNLPPPPLPAPSRLLVSVPQLAAMQPALSVSGIRWDLFNRELNGLAQSGAVIRRGRRLLLDAELYIDWLAKSGGTPTSITRNRAATPRRAGK